MNEIEKTKSMEEKLVSHWLISQMTASNHNYCPLDMKLKVLNAYANAHNGSIQAIKSQEAFSYNGKTYPVGRWIRMFRVDHEKLDEKTVQELENLNICWSIGFNYYSDELKLEVLKDYARYHINGLREIRTNDVYVYNGKKYRVGNWILIFRKNKANLSEKTIAQLDELNIAWSSLFKKTIDKKIKIKILTAYVSQNAKTIDDINLKETFKFRGEVYPVGIWINNFRRKKDNQTEEIISSLEDLGITWVGKEERENGMSRINCNKLKILTSYANEHDGTLKNITGDTIFDFNGKNYQIGRWVLEYRSRKNQLSNEVISKLSELGMNWSPKLGRPKKKELEL